jgi:hypothetical protein
VPFADYIVKIPIVMVRTASDRNEFLIPSVDFDFLCSASAYSIIRFTSICNSRSYSRRVY